MVKKNLSINLSIIADCIIQNKIPTVNNRKTKEDSEKSQGQDLGEKGNLGSESSIWSTFPLGSYVNS